MRFMKLVCQPQGGQRTWASAQQGHARLWIGEIQLGFSANVAMGGISHHIVELLSGDMNESTMVSALKVDITFAFKVFIDDALQRVGGP